jgi:hypothetical protein
VRLESPSRPVDFEVNCRFHKRDRLVTSVPCKFWLPRMPAERALISFVSKDRGHAALLEGPYDLEADVLGFDKKIQAIIRAQNFYIEGPSTTYSGDLEPVISGGGYADRLIVVRILGDVGKKKGRRTHLQFDLTPNQLLRPVQSVERSYTGNRKVKTHRFISVPVPSLGTVRFTNHYSDDFEAKLVAELAVDRTADELLGAPDQVSVSLEGLVLLASFAARQRTVTTSWHAADDAKMVSCYIGNISVPKARESGGFYETLIDPRDFLQFLRRTTKVYSKLEAIQKDLLQQALYKVLPDDRVIESRFLTCFSALESIVLWFRRLNDLEYSVPSSKQWKHLSRSFRAVLDNDVTLSNSRKMMILDMLGALRRVPLKHAFDAYCQQLKVDTSDLWPVFGCKGSLIDVRNRLSHGDTFHPSTHTALMRAGLNLEILVERMILAALRWPSDRSNAGSDFLKRMGWTLNMEVGEHVKQLANIPQPSGITDFT